MIDLDMIQDEIDALENSATNYPNLQKLSYLYITRAYANGATTLEIEPTSDFLSACRGKDSKALFNVLNEHMEAIRVLCPKEHDLVLRRIQRL